MRVLIFIFFATSAVYAQSIDDVAQLFASKNFVEAEKICKKFEKSNKEYAASRYWLGRISFAQTKFDDASDYLEEAIEVNNKVADYHYWYGNALGAIAQDANMIKQGMLAPKIKDAFEKTVSLDPNNLSAHWGLVQFYTRAPSFMGGSWEKANATARAIMKIKKADGYRALGVVAEAQEKFADAEKQFIAAWKEDAQYVYYLSAYYVRVKKYDQAFALFEEPLKKNPADMVSAYQFGRLSALSGQRLDEGEKYLLKYLAYQPKENEPSHAGANLRLAQIKEKKGKKSEAKLLYEAALKIDPQLKEAKEGLGRVR